MHCIALHTFTWALELVGAMELAPPDSPYGWVVAVSAASAQFVTLGSINCFGVFFEPLHKYFGVGNAKLAAVVSLANFVVCNHPHSKLWGGCGLMSPIEKLTWDGQVVWLP